MESNKNEDDKIELNTPNGNEVDVYKVPVNDFKSMLKDATYFVIRNIPDGRTWNELGTTGKSKVVNEFSPDYIHLKGRKGRPLKYKIITDEILEVDVTEANWYLFGFSLLACITFSWGSIADLIALQVGDIILKGSNCFAIVSSIILFFCFSFFIIRRLYCPVALLRFNRMKGTVEMPAARFKGWRGETKTIPFREMKLRYTGTAIRMLSIVDYNDRFYVQTLGLDEKLGLPFTIWFMDRNRPLPPGEIFDIYRIKDYERRKAEGFPPPLFPAYFDDNKFNPRKRPDISKLKLVKRIGTNEGVKMVKVSPEE